MKGWTFASLLALAVGPNQALAQQRIAVITESGTPVIATELLLTVGPIDETSEASGLAYLSARSIVAQVSSALDSLGARVDVSPDKDGLSFSLSAAPEVWEDASRILFAAIFKEPPDTAIVLGERDRISAELRGRLVNPADAARIAVDRAFYGVNHPWGRPTVGTPRTVQGLTFAQVQAFLRENFTPDRAYTVVVGPIDETEGSDHLLSMLSSVVSSPVEAIPYRPADQLSREDYNSVTSWVSASYFFPETGDEEALRFLAFLTADAMSFSPSRRSVYDVWSEVAVRVGGGEIRIQLVVPPEEATSWATQLEEKVAELASTSMHDDVFAAELRRYRGERIMSLIAPEDRARKAARQLLLRGQVVGVIPDFVSMTQERLQAAAATLGKPTMVILGPTLD